MCSRGSHDHHLTTPDLVRRVWMPAAALFLSASTAVLLFPFFTYVPLQGRMDGMLPQVCAAPWQRSLIGGVSRGLLPGCEPGLLCRP